MEHSIDNPTSRPTSKPHYDSLRFYHPNGQGSGSAMSLELKLNGRGNGGSNCFFLEMAKQKTVPNRKGSSRVAATFDWENKATVKLAFLDICELLAVLEAAKGQVGPGGRGLYHETAETNTIISFSKADKAPGFQLGISRKGKEGAVQFRGYIVLNDAESIGLRTVLQAALFHLAFHGSVIHAFCAPPVAGPAGMVKSL